MDLCGFPKMAYYLHQAQWVKDKPVLQLVPHWNWPSDSIGKPIKVMALSNADRVKLLLNGKEISEQKVDPYEMNSWFVPYKPGKLEAVGYKNGKVVSRTKVETTGEPVRLRLTPYRSMLAGDGRDAMPVTVEVLDSKGRPVPTADNMIEFTISGPAKIIGLGNGDPNSHELEKGNKRSLFNGLAQVIIQTTEEAGEVVLTATSIGMKSTALVIPVNKVVLSPFVAVENSPMILDRWIVSPGALEKPDVTCQIADNDMNSWQPVTISTDKTILLENANYIIFRTEFVPYRHLQKEGGIIFLKNVVGKAEVWLNGQLVGTKDVVNGQDLKVEFLPTEDKCELRVLLNGSVNKRVGLKGGVTVQAK